jgi:hypothetical protein
MTSSHSIWWPPSTIHRTPDSLTRPSRTTRPNVLMLAPHRILWLLLLLPLAAGCDTADPVPPEGIDFDRLLAEPTPAEVATIVAEWQSRADGGAYTAGAITIEYEGDLLGDGSRVVLIGHTTATSTARHYGAVRVPPGDGPFPILVVHHGGDRGFDLMQYLGVLAAPSYFGELANATITVLPTYRGEAMTGTPVGTLTSGGHPSPWDRDVDDALALLDAVIRSVPEADVSRIGTVGFSRGGGVALQMAARPLPAGYTHGVRAVTSYFGPTDLGSPAFREIAEQLAHFDGTIYELLPGAPFLKNEVLRPLLRGEITYEQARLEFIRRSPAHYAHRLTNVQVHHHHRDAIVPFDQFTALEARRGQIGGATEFYAYGTPGTPGVQFHSIDPAVLPGHVERTTDFLLEHVVGAPVALAATSY